MDRVAIMPSVLVTGAGRGIGRSIATHLASQGWDVIAGVRSKEDGAAITEADRRRISWVQLDITNTEQIDALAHSLPERLDAVVNNAGVVVHGPMEAVQLNDLRHQLEVNVIGQLAVTQAVLPRLRLAQGRIVFVSSVNGKVAFPLQGAYCASKFAIEAIADALRMELRPWKIAVAVVEPAQTDTEMWRTAETLVDETAAAMSAEHRDLYAGHLAGLKQSIPRWRFLVWPPEKVAEMVARALTAHHPRARYAVGLAARLQLAVLTRLPTAARDRALQLGARQPWRV
jgi:NAD(P)-dependent dehydrogenase (short-subunit alcohol dehydrogenase family)